MLRPVVEIKELKAAADQATLDEVRAFPQQPNVDTSESWKDVFGATPPGGALRRVCRRLGVQLHPSLRRCNYETIAEFKKESQRIKRWYKPGRKLTRRRRGIVRSRLAARRVRGRRTVWNQKVNKHYKRLRKKARLSGLWRWRSAALALHGAGVKVQSGTIPVERLWASMLDLFPRSARLISLEWFSLLSALSFLRDNYRHLHAALLPNWTEADSLLSERIDNLAAAARVLSEDDSKFDALFRPFAS